MAEKDKIPEIRFKGFSNKWEERKYSETFTKIPNNTLSRSELNYISGLAKNVHYGDVLIKFGELLDVKRDEIPYITDDSLVIKFKTLKLQNGDIVIADAAEDEMVGKCTELVNVGEEFVVSGLHTIPSRPILSFASGYLGYFMNSPAYHTQLLRLMQGTKVLSISKTVLQDTAIIYPNDNSEQSKIGTFSSHLDHLITLHQRKYNKLGTIKKAMLEKMFPQNGAVVPEIRFKRFTDPWEERKLESIFNKIRNAFVGTASPYYVDEGHFYLESNNVKDGQINRNSEIFINDEFYEKQKDNWLHTGDMVMVQSGHVGHSAVIPPELNNSAAHALIIFAEPKEKICSFFLNFQFQTTQVKKEIVNITTGNTIKHILSSEMKKFDVLLPEYNEQAQIGAFFNHLDTLITLQQHELEKLKNIKKACLEKMFV